ncbi:MAG: hypothetical protein ACK55I_37990, partial [bacterium]
PQSNISSRDIQGVSNNGPDLLEIPNLFSQLNLHRSQSTTNQLELTHQIPTRSTQLVHRHLLNLIISRNMNFN